MSGPTDQQDIETYATPDNRQQLEEMVAHVARLLYAIDQIEVFRTRRIARINATADEKAYPIMQEIRELCELVLLAASVKWDELIDPETSTPEVIECPGGVIRRTTDHVGTLAIDDAERAITFFESLGGDSDRFVKTTKEIRVQAVKAWLNENPDQEVPGVRLQHDSAVVLRVPRAPLAQRAGFQDHEIRRLLA